MRNFDEIVQKEWDISNAMLQNIAEETHPVHLEF